MSYQDTIDKINIEYCDLRQMAYDQYWRSISSHEDTFRAQLRHYRTRRQVKLVSMFKKLSYEDQIQCYLDSMEQGTLVKFINSEQKSAIIIIQGGLVVNDYVNQEFDREADEIINRATRTYYTSLKTI